MKGSDAMQVSRLWGYAPRLVCRREGRRMRGCVVGPSGVCVRSAVNEAYAMGRGGTGLSRMASKKETKQLPRDVRKQLRAIRAKGEAGGDGDEYEGETHLHGSMGASGLASTKGLVMGESAAGKASLEGSFSLEMSALSQSGKPPPGLGGGREMSGLSAVSDVSAEDEVGSHAKFAVRGRGLTVGVEWAEVKGLPKGAAVVLDVYVVRSAEHTHKVPHLQTAKKKHDSDGVWGWRQLTPVAVEPLELEEGLLHVRVMEKGAMRFVRWGLFGCACVLAFPSACAACRVRAVWCLLLQRAPELDARAA